MKYNFKFRNDSSRDRMTDLLNVRTGAIGW